MSDVGSGLPVYRGAWADQPYLRGDLVLRSGALYQAATDTAAQPGATVATPGKDNPAAWVNVTALVLDFTGSTDPTAGAGIPTAVGSTYRYAGTGLYVKTGSGATDWGDAAGGGGGTLADVLTAGNDTGGLTIINVVGGEDEEADVSRSATANGDGNALAKTTATANGDGNSDATTATTSVAGNATSNVNATSTDGTARVDRHANSTTWRATANTSVGADNNASANTTVVTADGAAEVKNVAYASGTGTAVASLTADAGNDAHVVTIELAATATGESITITGLPTSDPGVAGQIYSNGVPSAGVPKALMISGGTS